MSFLIRNSQICTLNDFSHASSPSLSHPSIYQDNSTSVGNPHVDTADLVKGEDTSCTENSKLADEELRTCENRKRGIEAFPPVKCLIHVWQKGKDNLRGAIKNFHTIATPDYQAINEKFDELEGYLNIYGKLPVISTLSGAIRVVFGLNQIIWGLTYALFHLILLSITKPKNKEVAAKRVKMDLAYCIHGFANILRSGIEINKVSNPLLGRVVPFLGRVIYDMAGARLKYPTVPDALIRKNFAPLSSAV